MKNTKLTYYIDALFCLVILPALLLLLPIDRWLEHRTIFVILLISWLYFVYFAMRGYIVVKMIQGRKREKFLAFAIIVISLFTNHLFAQFEGNQHPQHIMNMIGVDDPEIHRQIVGDRMRMPDRKLRSYQMQMQAVWFLYCLVSSFGLSVALLTQIYRNRAINEAIIHDKRRAELALYKAQINPHFLFNTLNTIYGLIVTKSDRAEEAFILFTNLMKYIYTNGSADRVKLSDEVEYIGQYIELQKLRMSEITRVNYSCSERVNQSQESIPPMILITFIENIFKHGVSSHIPTVLDIDINLVDGELVLITENPIINKVTDGGIGVANCRERLELLYPNRYKLHIRQNGDKYSLELNIRLS